MVRLAGESPRYVYGVYKPNPEAHDQWANLFLPPT